VQQQVTFFVNSLCHFVGTQKYTNGTSRDIWWLALLLLGENWHNFHHAFPSDYRNGHKWHQFDVHINRQGFCKACDHTGAAMKEVCVRCGGQGCVSQIIQMGPMTMNTIGPCLECQGKGERVVETCKPCSGSGMVAEKKRLTIKVPPGKLANETSVFPEVCSDHPGFEKPADVHIVISEDTKDPGFQMFKRSGKNLECTVTLSLPQSLLGTVVQLDHHPGYEDGLFIQIPPGSFALDRFCLVGGGMPVVGQLGVYGDLFITIAVHITEEDRKQYIQVVPFIQINMKAEKENTEKEKAAVLKLFNRK
jgi:DnaJ-class molecular chaperone